MSFARVVTNLARQASPEQRERVRRLRMASIDTPDEHLAPDVKAARDDARAEIAMAVHGIVVGAWACPCGTGYTYPHSLCPTCKRDYPRRCVTPGCGNANELETRVTAGGLEAELVRTHCIPCSTDSGRKRRADSFAHSTIPPRERRAAQRLIAYPHQAKVLEAIDAWLDLGPHSRTWKRDKSEVEANLGGTCAVFLSGDPGRGKSVIAAHIAHRAFVDLALVTDFRWHSHATLAQLFAERHSGEDEHRARAIADWRAITECPLLIVDDIFAQALTPAFGEALGSMLRERLDWMRPMVLTSNHPPHWQSYFETDVGRLQSRWTAYGLELVVGGTDLRRAA